MDDRSRRFWTVLIFLVVGPVLTAALLGASFFRKSPYAVSLEIDAIRKKTGLNLTCESIDYLRPHLLRFRGVQFHHPRTGEPLVVIPELLFDDAAGHCSAENVRIVLDPREKQQNITQLGNAIFSLFPRRFSGETRPWTFLFQEMEISVPGAVPKEEFRFTLLKGKYSAEESLEQIDCRFNMSDNLIAEPVRFSVGRTRMGKESRLFLELNTDEAVNGTSWIPTRMLALVFPSLRFLGENASCTGKIRADSAEEGVWSIHAGNVSVMEMNLKRIAERLTPYRLSGRMSMSFQSAKVVCNHGEYRFLEATDGWFAIEEFSGSIQKELLMKLVNHFALKTNAQESLSERLARIPPENDVPLKQVILNFDLNEKGVRLYTDDPQGCIMSVLTGNSYLFFYFNEKQTKPNAPRRPYTTLLYPFIPDSAELVPFTPQTQRILKILPWE